MINNALNYSGDSRHVTVRQECIGDTVKVSVQDFGLGIAKENLPLVWERYYKIDKEHVPYLSYNSVPRQAVNSPLQYPVQNPAPIPSQYHLYTPDAR